MKKYKNKKILRGVKRPRLTQRSIDFLNMLPPAEMEKYRTRHKERMWNVITFTCLSVLSGGFLRDLNVIEKSSIYTNNEEVIQNNLNIIGEDDFMFVRSILNNEICVNMQKNYTVGFDPALGAEQELALREAVNYMNYILQGLNPDYSIKIKSVNDPIMYRAADIVVTDYNDFRINLREKIIQLRDPSFEMEDASMISSYSQGFVNNNGIYKSYINVDVDYFNYFKEEGTFHDYTTSVYIHELCHCIFGFDDVRTSKYTIMDYKDNLDTKSMYYTDLINAAAAICDLSNEEEKIRVYNFISQELMRQVELGIGSEDSRIEAQKQIGRLQAEVSILQN